MPAKGIRETIKDVFKNDYMLSTLALAFDWMKEWSKSLLDIDKANDKMAISQILRLVELYGLAAKLGCRRLQNGILDAFGERNTCPDSYPSRRFIKLVYKHACKYSTLRRYVVDTFVFKSRQWAGNGKDHWIKLHTEYGNRGFVADVVKAEKVGEFGDPNRKPDCYYHYHSSDKACT